MVVRRRKKHRKFRGRRTYKGAKKRRRGAGRRGGRGLAGLHKHKWTYTVKYTPEHFGKRGFVPPKVVMKPIKAINLEELDKIAEKLVEQKLAEKVDNKIKINLQKIGYERVLGGGKVTKPLIIETKYFSRKAKEKLEASGGGVVVI
ncbi:MAG: uL15 family ribosomal protein [Candidatus Aenigmarchaeota archaeon]|nr:uL15 family ribosomal protein [Candidatus Aenigmarchaeota archaeon]